MTPCRGSRRHPEAVLDRLRRQAGQPFADRRQADRTSDVGRSRPGCERAAAAFEQWRTVPAPRRGELVRLLGEQLREAKPVLAKMITLEAGKIIQESLGEVQEMIDICDFAVGLSRQLYGLTIASERPNHRMMEQWHPLGPVLVISAFNFPVAVWAWNAALALVCGNPVIWKPSEKTPLCAELVMAVRPPRAARVRRCARRPGPAGARRARCRRGAGRRPAHRFGLGDRIDRDGPRRGPARRPALRPGAARAWRQQCDDRLPVARTSSLPRARSCFRLPARPGQRCTTLAPADRPRQRRRRAAGAARSSCSRR